MADQSTGSAAEAMAHPSGADPSSQVVTVWGIRQARVGVALSASEGVVTLGRFEDRPLLRVGELAEVVPGLAATQHSGTGKANQYFLRGFNLDHGTDFTISLDGIPLNQRTSAHGQGYLDINHIIPEIIERVSFRKGVATVGDGDFSAAGSARFSTVDALPEGFGQIELGENGWRRLVSALPVADGEGYVALDLTGDDGPWDRPEGFSKVNTFASLRIGDFRLGAGAYDAEWNATDQIPLRAVESGRISRLGAITTDTGGETQRAWVNLAYAGQEDFTANLYAAVYRLQLFSNFTYFLADPVNGDGFEQRERRVTVGGALERVLPTVGSWTPRIGGEFRFDRIDPLGLFASVGRTRLSTVREDRVDQGSLGAYADVVGDFGALRINLGLRADAMSVDVEAGDPRNGGTARDVILSPKAALAWQIGDSLEVYANAGGGFHSNDARGAVIRFDPATGTPATPVPLFVRAEGLEAGLRYERRRVSVTMAAFGLDLGSELVYVGDAGATEPSAASRRAGVELTTTVAATDWLTLDASAAATRARFLGHAAGEDRIPLATEYIITGGATIRLGPAWTGTVTLRHVGPAPLLEDNSVRSKASTVTNARIAWRGGRWTLAVEALNLFDSNDADITYFYTSRLPGEPVAGVDDIHFHPVPPRSLRLQVRIGL